jgi:hypothetical protein
MPHRIAVQIKPPGGLLHSYPRERVSNKQIKLHNRSEGERVKGGLKAKRKKKKKKGKRKKKKGRKKKTCDQGELAPEGGAHSQRSILTKVPIYKSTNNKEPHTLRTANSRNKAG